MSSKDTKDKAITRRKFLKGAATAGAAGLLLGPGSTPVFGASKSWLPDKWDYEADVIVIGNGYAGQNAAIFSHDGGAKALIIDKAPEEHAGGNSMCSGGGMTIPTDVKKATPYYHALSWGTSPKELCDFMAEALHYVPEQLNKLGIENFVGSSYENTPPERMRGLRILPGANYGKIYYIKKTDDMPSAGNGFLLHLALDKCVKSRGIPIHYETRARHLIQDPVTKRIVGVIAEQKGRKIYLKARKAVVLACGGYENNPEMLANFNYPGIRIYPWGSPYNTGDGINMVSEIGAPLWHTFSVEWSMHSAKEASEHAGVSVANSIRGSSIFVNRYGKRFMDEDTSMVHTKESLALLHFDNDRVEYPNYPFYTIFDESSRSSQRGGRGWGGMTWNGVFGVYQWSEGYKAEIEKGWIKKGDTIKSLAANMKIDPNALQETITNYNKYCSDKKDPDFNRAERSLRALTKPPYYGMELALTLINTQGGPKHNTKAQTLDQFDKPIPGLYSPGEFGSFFGFLYPGGSNIPEAIAFGRIAGENAAKEKPWS